MRDNASAKEPRSKWDRPWVIVEIDYPRFKGFYKGATEGGEILWAERRNDAQEFAGVKDAYRVLAMHKALQRDDVQVRLILRA
jgi:hypothetical protein